MELRCPRQAGFSITFFTFLIFLHGSRGEIPPKPSASVTIIPPVKPDNGPQAFPSDEKANLPVFTMDYPRIQIPFEITLWMLLASFAKIGEEPKVILLLTQNLLSIKAVTQQVNCPAQRAALESSKSLSSECMCYILSLLQHPTDGHTSTFSDTAVLYLFRSFGWKSNLIVDGKWEIVVCEHLLSALYYHNKPHCLLAWTLVGSTFCKTIVTSTFSKFTITEMIRISHRTASCTFTLLFQPC